MNRMIGLFIGLGPILMFVVFAFLWPDVEEGLELVEALMANQTLSTFYLLFGVLGFTMMQSGLILLSRQLMGQASHGLHGSVSNLAFRHIGSHGSVSRLLGFS